MRRWLVSLLLIRILSSKKNHLKTQPAMSALHAILIWWRDDLSLLPAYQGRNGGAETVDILKIDPHKARARIETEIAARD